MPALLSRVFLIFAKTARATLRGPPEDRAPAGRHGLAAVATVSRLLLLLTLQGANLTNVVRRPASLADLPNSFGVVRGAVSVRRNKRRNSVMTLPQCDDRTGFSLRIWKENSRQIFERACLPILTWSDWGRHPGEKRSGGCGNRGVRHLKTGGLRGYFCT